MIEKLKNDDFPDIKYDEWIYENVPQLTLDNFQILIKKVNELVDLVNKITPQGLVETPRIPDFEDEW